MSDAFIQSLEDRKLFAAQPVSLSPSEVVNPHLFPQPVTVEAGSQTKQAQAGNKNKLAAEEPLVRATDLRGEWEGRVKVRYKFFSRKFDFDLSIINQTQTTISGRIDIDGREFEGTFFGKINPKNGRFRYILDEDDDSVTITGQLSKRGAIIGGGNIKADYIGLDIKGSFRLDRVA